MANVGPSAKEKPRSGPRPTKDIEQISRLRNFIWWKHICSLVGRKRHRISRGVKRREKVVIMVREHHAQSMDACVRGWMAVSLRVCGVWKSTLLIDTRQSLNSRLKEREKRKKVMIQIIKF
ncbi:hypothetical protein EAF00_007128 [Botryotinia globosa]|nr:hypothetical protein EAF00_007128 [Botryotinia globosa]